MFKRTSMTKSDDAQAALNAAVRILTRREYSKLELYNRLLLKFTAEASLKALKKCIENNFQSEERFASMLFNHLVSSLYGPQKIIMEMTKKGVKNEIYSSLMEETDFVEIAAKFLKKKLEKPIADYTFEEKQKLLCSLARRGFSNSVCLEALDLIDSE